MEGTLNKHIIIDFFGLPGCGKSTISHELAKKLRNNGNIVAEPTYDLDHGNSAGKRKLYKIFCAINYTICHPINAKRLFSVIRKCGNGLSDSYKLSITILSRISMINNADNITVLDEGLTQMAISICQNSDNTVCLQAAYDAIARLIDNKYRICMVYLKSDIGIAIERAARRATKESRVDREENQEKKMAIYNYFESACGCFANQADISVDLDQDIESIVLQIMEVL